MRKRIETLKQWMGYKDEVYPRRKYVKRCEKCSHKEPETMLGYNCPKCKKKESMKVTIAKV